MNDRLDMAKAALRFYLRQHYSDAQLVALLDHARAGLLAYHSCCCVAGIPTADHALQGHNAGRNDLYAHLRLAYMLPGARQADAAYCTLGRDDAARRRRIIPVILGEIRRRSTKLTQSKEMDRGKAVLV